MQERSTIVIVGSSDKDPHYLRRINIVAVNTVQIRYRTVNSYLIRKTLEFRLDMEEPQDEPQEFGGANHAQGRRRDAEQPASNDEEAPRKSDDDGGDCFYFLLALGVLIVGVTIIVIMLVVVKDDDDDDSIPAPAPTASLSPAPVEMISDPQARLDVLVEALGENEAAKVYLEGQISREASDFIGVADDSSEDPITRAASWVVQSDQYFAKREIVERFALMAVFYTNGGDGWVLSNGWGGEDSICNWIGVSCCSSFSPHLDPHQCIDKTDHEVVELDLHDNNLKGPIPAAIALLESCHILNLGRNELTGQLDPTIFANMPNLDALHVQRNRLTGEIAGSIRSNGKLDTLLTHGNDFSGTWPAEFCASCVQEGICESAPVVWTLNCRKVACSPFCCPSSGQQTHRLHCFSDGD